MSRCFLIRLVTISIMAAFLSNAVNVGAQVRTARKAKAASQAVDTTPSLATHSARLAGSYVIQKPEARLGPSFTTIGPSQPTVGLTIVATFDASVPPAMQASINNAIGIFQATFTDPITVPILFRFDSNDADGTPLPTSVGARSRFVVYPKPWATFTSALFADRTSANDTSAVNHLPPQQTPTIRPSSPNARAVGLSGDPAMCANGTVAVGCPYDGIVTLNAAIPFSFTRPVAAGTFDAQRAIEHEIDEVLAIGSLLDAGGGDWRPEDLFTFSAPNTWNVTTTGPRYISFDGGVTDVIDLNQDPAADHGDWLSQLVCPQANPFVQNAVACTGQFADISRTSPEGVVMDVLGYNLAPPTAAMVSVSGRVMSVSGTAIRNARVSMTAPDGSTTVVATNSFGFYNFDQVESGRDYMVNVSAKGYTFDSRLLTVQDTVTGADFVANQ